MSDLLQRGDLGGTSGGGPSGTGVPSVASVLASLRRFRWSVVVLTLLGLAAGIALSALSTPVYQVNTTFFADGQSLEDGALEKDEYVQRRINSYVGVVTSESVADEILDDTGLDLSRREVMRRITASVDEDTVLLRVRVEDTSRERAQTIAEALADTIDDVISDLEGGDDQTEIELTVISGPTAASDPVSPNVPLNVAVGLLVGLALGLSQAILRGQYDRTYRNRDVLAADTGLPVLAVVPHDRKASRHPVLTERQMQTQRAESFRHLRTSLRFIHAASPAKVIIVTSAVEDEGKTSTAANLAVTLAMAGDRVLLVDADLRKPSLEKYLDIESGAGLTNVLVDRVPVEQLIQSWPRHGLEVLASGPLPPNPSELLGGAGMSEVLETLSDLYDVVIVDTPPLLPVTDAAVLAVQADGVLLVVRAGATRSDRLHSCLETLENINARVFGTVLTMSKSPEVQESSSYYQRPAGA